MLNREKLLPRTLQSVINQTLRPFDFILVDNGSEDGTAEVIRKWVPRIEKSGIRVKTITEPRRGPCQARNSGLNIVETEYVMFFDSDDEMLPNHLKFIHEELTKRPETDLLWFDIKEQDEDGWSKLRAINDKNIMRGHILHATLACARFVVRTELIKQLGGFDESISAWEDLELGVRLLLASKNSRKMNYEPQAIIHPHRESITGSSFSSKSYSLEKSLDLCEDALRRSGRHDDIIWVNVKRMVLSGLYAREGNKKSSERLSDRVLDRTEKGGHRVALGFVRDTVTYFGRGGCAIAKALIRTDKGSKKE